MELRWRVKLITNVFPKCCELRFELRYEVQKFMLKFIAQFLNKVSDPSDLVPDFKERNEMHNLQLVFECQCQHWCQKQPLL